MHEEFDSPSVASWGFIISWQKEFGLGFGSLGGISPF